MKKFLLSLLVIFLAYYTAYHTSGASKKQDLFDLGDSPMMYKIKCALSGETDTTDANELYNRAVIYLDSEDYEMAIKDYKRAIKLDPNILFARLEMAKAYLGLGDTVHAIECYHDQINNSFYPEDAYSKLGQLYQKMNKLDSAIYYYKKTIENDPEYHLPYFYLAELNFEKEAYNEALTYINQAIELSEYDMDYRNLRRRIYLKLDKKEMAEADYQYILANDANYFGNYAEIAKEENENGEYKKAVENYTLALEEQPDDIELLKARAWVYHSLQAYDSALTDFRKVAELNPDYSNYFNVAYTLDFLDSIEASIEYYDKTIDLKSDYYLAYNNRGYEYYRLKKYKESEKDYTKSIKYKGDYYLNYYNRGILYAEQKKYTKAIKDYKQAVKYTESPQYIIYDMANAYDKAKNKKEAIYYYNEYLKIAAETDTIRTNYVVNRVAELSK